MPHSRLRHLIRSRHLLLALLAPLAASAGEPVKLDVYVDGELEQHVVLQGFKATSKFVLHKAPDTQLEIQLIAPAPLIVEVRESSKSSGQGPQVGRAKLLDKGAQFNLSELKNSHFQREYILVKPD